MADIGKLKADLETLRSARRSGALRTKIGEREVLYRSDAELQRQIAALEEEIAAAEGTGRAQTVVLRGNKGWL